MSKADTILFNKIRAAVTLEFVQATCKFSAFNSTHEGYAVILEELDELWAEVMANNTEAACKEAVQVAAMAMRFIFDLMPSGTVARDLLKEIKQ